MAKVQTLRPFSSAALIATGVGTWDYDIAADRYTLDPIGAALLGFTSSEGAAGISLARIMEAVHPDDARALADRVARLVAEGGIYVVEYRLNVPGPERWVLSRGHQPEVAGKATHRRGIIVEVTAQKRGGYADGCVAVAPDRPEAALGLAVDAALAAHAAILAMGTERRRSLLPLVELLVHELGKQTAEEG